MDLNDFRRISDTLGDGGGLCCKRWRTRFARSLRREDVLVREGGDRFVRAPGVRQPEVVGEIAVRVQSCITADLGGAQAGGASRSKERSPASTKTATRSTLEAAERRLQADKAGYAKRVPRAAARRRDGTAISSSSRGITEAPRGRICAL